ncbi:hypothetical protein CC1G_10690 [Coprinopsis cinerea okayama7|uniref:Uncharacterized protein n=1 Tax=Coprinopsis cinerea (strain Okayama-7 / 130 / ATCC MYA-4618 / FGSC 9003) TaxID=240176 RepID=A8NDR9_COPC7|nr:hypothetical protein CC1G_10690 [Coprinopsis cinerea okayama7\|eukprot:XP_001832841.1 hypothetical protein CC1G_10690 [Coprinopsis cinerea okayama7\
MSRLPKGLWATRSITLQAGYPLSIFGIFLSSIGYPDELQYYLGQPVGAHMENQLRAPDGDDKETEVLGLEIYLTVGVY